MRQSIQRWFLRSRSQSGNSVGRIQLDGESREEFHTLFQEVMQHDKSQSVSLFFFCFWFSKPNPTNCFIFRTPQIIILYAQSQGSIGRTRNRKSGLGSKSLSFLSLHPSFSFVARSLSCSPAFSFLPSTFPSPLSLSRVSPVPPKFAHTAPWPRARACASAHKLPSVRKRAAPEERSRST